MKSFSNPVKLILIIFLVFASIGFFFFFHSSKKDNLSLNKPDLTIYTPLSKTLYQPIIKEFQERNDVYIDVHTENIDTIINSLRNSSFDGDLILGIHNGLAKENSTLFLNYETLNSIPFVIAFNNHLLTSYEKIESYDSLINPIYKDKIGFVDPNLSSIYNEILGIMSQSSNNPELFKKLFISNVKDNYMQSTEEINQALKNGTISIAITSEQSASLLSQQISNISFLNKDDCIVNFDIAQPKNTDKLQLSSTFFEFVKSADVKRFMSSYLNNNIGGITYGLD